MAHADRQPESGPAGPVCARCGIANPPEFRFCGHCGAALDRGSSCPAGASIAAERPHPERRQVTVVFCDLVGSTKLAARLDPEDMRSVLRSFQSACTPVVRKFDGTISRYMGDGFLALFGYPRAHEDDAERAVRAGLDIILTMATLSPPVAAGNVGPLQVRIGIATGIVVAGDLIGEGPAEEESVVGDTLNLAARLQAIASPNSLVIAPGTRALLGERFDCMDLGEHSLNGFPEPVRAWRVFAPRFAGSRFEAAQPVGITPLIDRDEYMSWLWGLWQEAASSRGRVALLAGDAGIGKSRLVRALRDRLSGTPYAALRYQCSPHYVNTALYPVIAHIQRAAGIAREDTPSLKLAKFSAWLGPGPQTGEAVALLGALLSMPPDERFPLPAMSAQRQKERTFELIVWFMQRLSQERPLLILFEDLHWIDPTTREFMTVLIDRVREMRALVILTYRPDFLPSWGDQPHIEQRGLKSLAPEHARGLARQVAGEQLPQAVIEQVVAKTDGVPLFVEELTRAVLGTQPTDGQTTPGRVPSLLAIPFTLQDSLMARLDQLGPAKFIAQVAGAIGREFSYDLLEAVARLPSERLRAGLRVLERSGLVYADPRAPALGYVFKHALVQETAYQSLLRSHRRDLHLRIAAALENRFPQTTREAPELVAHHWTEAGEIARAVAAWLVAGQRASERSEYREAIGHLRRGLDLIPLLEDTDERRSRELTMLLALGPALIMAEGAGTSEVARLYARALDLCAGLAESPSHFVAHWGWWRASMDHRMGRARADKLVALARNLDDPALLLQAHHCEWATLYMLGAHSECCQHIDAGLALYDPNRDRVHAALYGGHDARVCGLGERALATWMLGRPDQALAQVNSAVAWAHKLSHVGSRAHAMDYALVLQKFRGDVQAVQQQAHELVAFAAEQKLRVFHAKGAFFRGWSRARLSDVSAGLAEMLDGIASEQAADTPHDFALYYEMLAEIYGLRGEPDRGLAAVDDAFAVGERHGIVFWNAELHRRRGQLLLAAGKPGGARTSFLEALACARAQQARSLELRAAVSLARLMLDAGDSESARTILVPVYESFTEGFDTCDLVEARGVILALEARVR